MRKRGLTFRFVWIPAHSRIRGNETTNSVGKPASYLPFTVVCGVLREDLFSVLNRELPFYLITWAKK